MTAIEILRNEHAVVLEAVELLEQHTQEIQAGRPVGAEFARWMVAFIREFVDDTHHAKEEGVLFRMLLSHGLAADAAPLAGTWADHRANRELATAMERALDRGDSAAFVAAALALGRLLRRHFAVEDASVFTLAEDLLSQEEDAQAVQAFGRVVQERGGVLVRQRHLAAIERWRGDFASRLPSGA